MSGKLRASLAARTAKARCRTPLCTWRAEGTHDETEAAARDHAAAGHRAVVTFTRVVVIEAVRLEVVR